MYNSWRSFGYFCASFFFSILSIRACERSEAERVRCVVEAAPQARPEDHLLALNTTWDLPVLCNIASTMVLSVFWQLRFLSIFDGFRGRHLDVFGQLWNNNCVLWHACLQVTFFKDFGM